MELLDKILFSIAVLLFVVSQVFGVVSLIDGLFLLLASMVILMALCDVIHMAMWQKEFNAMNHEMDRRWQQDRKIKAGEPTLRGVVKAFRVEGSNVTYSGSMVVGDRKVEFMDLGPPTIKIGCEYKIWMNGKRLLKYQEVSEWGEG